MKFGKTCKGKHSQIFFLTISQFRGNLFKWLPRKEMNSLETRKYTSSKDENPLLEPARKLVRIAQERLGPERDGLQTRRFEAPDGTFFGVARYVDVDDDIYRAGYVDPFATGITITFTLGENNEETSLHLPRRPKSVNENTIRELAGVSPETLTALAEDLKNSQPI